MLRGAIVCAVLVGLSIGGRSAEPGGDPLQSSLSRCTSLQQEIDEQRRLLNEMFAGELLDGVKSGAWLEADRLVALESYADILEPLPAEDMTRDDAMRRSRAKRTPERGAILPEAAMRVTTPVEQWFLLRRYYLDRLFDSATHWQAQLALQYAENVWLTAQKASDLAPAIRPLLDARERGVRWPMLIEQRRASPVTQPFALQAGARPVLQTDAVYTFDAWTILASPDALLPPDPETATAAEFTRWWETWKRVRQIGNTFLYRPNIAARAAEALGRRREVEDRTADAIERLILEDAPLAQLEEKCKAMSDLVAGRPEPPRRANSSLMAGVIRDYRDVVGELNLPNTGMMLANANPRQNWLRACLQYLQWKKAAEGGTANPEPARLELRRSLAYFSSKVEEHVRKQVDEVKTRGDERRIPEVVPGKAAESLASALEKFAKPGQGRHREAADFSALAQAVRIELATPVSRERPAERFDRQWLVLAGDPEAQPLIALRDAAIRARLQALEVANANDVSSPVLVIWREAIVREAEAGRFEAVTALHDLDRRYSMSSAEEFRGWREFLVTVQSPGSGLERRDRLRRQLPLATPALMRVIALQLRQITGGRNAN